MILILILICPRVCLEQKLREPLSDAQHAQVNTYLVHVFDLMLMCLIDVSLDGIYVCCLMCLLWCGVFEFQVSTFLVYVFICVCVSCLCCCFGGVCLLCFLTMSCVAQVNTCLDFRHLFLCLCLVYVSAEISPSHQV